MIVRLVWCFLLLVSAPAVAQVTDRVVPSVDDPRPFVEDADPGAPCPACQVLLLREVEGRQSLPGTPLFSPYLPGNGWSLGYEHLASSASVFIYDGATGITWLVDATPLARMPLLPASALRERAQVLTLRPGMFWVAGDLDGDGRDDLVGHDKRTGEVVRLFRRGGRK